MLQIKEFFSPKEKLVYLFIKYHAITNYVLIIYELSNFDHVLGVSGVNRTHDPHVNSLGIFFPEEKLVYSFINHNAITNYVLITYALGNFDHVIGVSDGNRTHDPYANSLRIFFAKEKLVYLFINYNAITNYILIIYKISSFDHVFGVWGENRTHDPHVNSLGIFFPEEKLVYFFVNHNAITNYVLIIYALGNFDHVIGVSDGNNSLRIFFAKEKLVYLFINYNAIINYIVLQLQIILQLYTSWLTSIICTDSLVEIEPTTLTLII